jgi:hypothetical protein
MNPNAKVIQNHYWQNIIWTSFNIMKYSRFHHYMMTMLFLNFLCLKVTLAIPLRGALEGMGSDQDTIYGQS